MQPVRTHKQRPEFGNPTHVGKEFPRFIPVPISQPVISTLPLNAVLGHTRVSDIQQAGQIVFHAVGDTGGHNGTEVEEAIAVAMEAQFGANPHDNPSFFYQMDRVSTILHSSMSRTSTIRRLFLLSPAITMAIRMFDPLILPILNLHCTVSFRTSVPRNVSTSAHTATL